MISPHRLWIGKRLDSAYQFADANKNNYDLLTVRKYKFEVVVSKSRQYKNINTIFYSFENGTLVFSKSN